VARLVELWELVGAKDGTLHLAITLLDQVIDINYPDIDYEQLKVVMVTCLIIAIKVEEGIEP